MKRITHLKQTKTKRKTEKEERKIEFMRQLTMIKYVRQSLT